MVKRIYCIACNLSFAGDTTNKNRLDRDMDVRNTNCTSDCCRSFWRKYWPHCTYLVPAIDFMHSYSQIYSVFVVLYRTFTFNDCPDAAEEIQRQIKEAKADLATKGLKLWERSRDGSQYFAKSNIPFHHKSFICVNSCPSNWCKVCYEWIWICLMLSVYAPTTHTIDLMCVWCPK